MLPRKDLEVKDTILCHQCCEWEMLKAEKFRFPLRVFGEKAMATLSSTLAWQIPWTEDPGGLGFTGLQSVGHD